MSLVSALSNAVGRLVSPGFHDLQEFSVLTRPTLGGDLRMPGGDANDWNASPWQEPAHTFGAIPIRQANERTDRMAASYFKAPFSNHNVVTDAGAFIRYNALSLYSQPTCLHISGRMLVNGGREEDAKYIVMEPQRGLMGVIQNQWGTFMKPGSEGHWVTGAHVMVAKSSDLYKFLENHSRPLKETHSVQEFMAEAARTFLEKQVLYGGRGEISVRDVKVPSLGGSHFANFDSVLEASAPGCDVKVVIARIIGDGEIPKAVYAVYFINGKKDKNLALWGDNAELAVRLGNKVSRFEEDGGAWTVSSALKPDDIEYPMITELARFLINGN